jgi:alanyl-tRNA synthetase
MCVVSKRFEEYGFPFVYDRSIIPDDDTTLFICSGMQNLKNCFQNPDGRQYGSIQSCIRTNDLDLVGDGSHLTYFEMIGNFSFGGVPYEHSVSLWDAILKDLGWRVEIHVHPSRDDHRLMWTKLGHQIVDDVECMWSDGQIGGNCCEVYIGNLEIGNLVNTLEHSTDVGFGLERMLQVFERKNRVDETSIFDQSLPPIVRDHVRSLSIMLDNGVEPGNKGRNYVCRRLLRRVMRQVDCVPQLEKWIRSEQELLDNRLEIGRKMWRRHKDKPPEWWWDTCGIMPEEMLLLEG